MTYHQHISPGLLGPAARVQLCEQLPAGVAAENKSRPDARLKILDLPDDKIVHGSKDEPVRFEDTEDRTQYLLFVDSMEHAFNEICP